MTTKTVRLTMAQAVARFLTRQMTMIDGVNQPIFGGVFAIFGHGNVAGLGEALHGVREEITTYRAQNEQGMANAAAAFAKASFRLVSRYFDRITRPKQIVPTLRRAMQVLTDPAECGPVTLALCQDVQAEAFDYPARFFEEKVWTPRRPRTVLIAIDTDHPATTEAGGHGWDVAVPEVSEREQVRQARRGYEKARAAQRLG